MEFYSFTLSTYFYHLTFLIKMQLSLLSGRISPLLERNILPVISFFESHFSRVYRKKKNLLLYSEYPGCFGGSLFFFGLIICFASFPLLFLEFWESIYYFARETCFTIFYVFVKLRSLDYIFTIWECFVLITYLQCNIFICLRYLWRTIFLRLNNMFFRIAFVSDTWEELYYFALRLFFRILFVSDIWEDSYHFALIICFSILHLSQIPRKNHITSP